ncbi:MAG: prepilin-type N-terminal cleavage/methylation domain-containing protein [Planctomycetota bacterium]|nr:prepilin-type N-terminal cleavage/methylation domain-containing protein [Planctomycetota bacterium]
MSCSHRLVAGEDPRVVNSANGSRSAGFTLIELMIVVAIIAVLSTLVTKMIQQAQAKAAEASATSTISSIGAALNAYNRDEGVYPAWDLKVDDSELEDFNAFPVLYENIAGERPPEGKGGRNSPYVDLDNEMIAVVDLEYEGEFIRPGRDDLFDPDVEKFYLDPWMEPFRYRENDSKRRKEDWMIKRSGFDLWSIGPDGDNAACFGLPDEGEEYDDIGNW